MTVLKKNYTKLFQTTGDLKFLEERGELQFKREHFAESGETYRLYFSNKGKSYKAAYYYAHSLAKTGDIESAIQYFDSILRSKTAGFNGGQLWNLIWKFWFSNNRIGKAKEILSWVNKANKGAVNTQSQIQTWRKKFNI